MTRILVVMRLGEKKVIDHLTPMLNSENIEHIWLLRHKSIALQSDKLTQITPPQLISLSGRSKLGLLVRFGYLLYAICRGFRLVRRENIEVVTAFNLVPYGLLGWLIAQLTGAKCYVSLIGTDYNWYIQQSVFSGLLWRILPTFDKVTIYGKDEREALIARGLSPQNVYVLPNTIDTQHFAKADDHEVTYDLVFVGYLRKLKRVDLILQMLVKLLIIRPETTLLIVGDGEEKGRLQELADSLNITHAVTFYGWSSHPAEQLAQGRIFISMSDTEGIPMALLEAMTIGLPPIITNVGAIDTVIQHEVNGYLLSLPVDLQQACQYVLKLLSDYDHYATMRAHSFQTGQQYDHTSATQVWNRLLRDAK